MDVGALLRGARERRGLTLERVASSTKLSPLVLQSIEHNEWDRLPGGLITRGHLRAYAAAVGVDPEAVVHEYLAQLPPVPAGEPLPLRAAVITPGAIVSVVMTVFVGIVAAVAIYGWLREAPPARRSTPARADVPTASATPENQPSAVPEPAVADVAPAAQSQPLRLSLAIDATGPCWVSATADGRVVLYRLLNAGDAFTMDAYDELVLRVGDPGALTYRLNGASGRPFGAVGQPVTVTITPDNAHAFLATSTPSDAAGAADR